MRWRVVVAQREDINRPATPAEQDHSRRAWLGHQTGGAVVPLKHILVEDRNGQHSYPGKHDTECGARIKRNVIATTEDKEY